MIDAEQILALAQAAGAYRRPVYNMQGYCQMSTMDERDFAPFAALVAEECARLCVDPESAAAIRAAFPPELLNRPLPAPWGGKPTKTPEGHQP